MTTAFNSNFKHASITLSNGGLTATTTAGNNEQVRCDQFHETGKYYFEFGAITVTTGAMQVGLSGACFISNDNTFFQVRVDQTGGLVNSWGPTTGFTSIGTITGHVIGIAVDLDHNKIWFRNDAGNWNGSGTADPATNTGGIDISGRCALTPWMFLQNGTATLNISSGSWAHSAPSGFSDWDTSETSKAMVIGTYSDLIFGTPWTNRGLFSANVDDVLVVCTHAEPNNATPLSATAVTAAGGALTLTKADEFQFTSNSIANTLDVWWVHVTSAVKDAFISGTYGAAVDAGILHVLVVRGLEDPTAPFDAKGFYHNSGAGSSNPTVSIDTFGTTASLAIMGRSTSGGPAGIGSTNGDSFEMLANQFANSNRALLETIIQRPPDASSQTAHAMTFPSATTQWGVIGFSFAGPGNTGAPSGDVSVPGTTMTVTASLISGQFETNVPGQTLTVTASLISGEAGPISVVDGHQIFEIATNISPAKRYLEADYHSIWSQGDRVANGLMTVGVYGKTPSTPIAELYDASLSSGNGFTFGGGTQPAGWAHWFDTGVWGIEIRGLSLSGGDLIDEDDGRLFKFVGGTGIGEVSNDSYALEFDAFSSSEANTSDVTDTMYHGENFTEYQVTPRNPVQWSHYEFVWAGGATFSGETKFSSELRLKVAHSVLDGGDRRSTNGRPEKQVGFTLGPGWVFRGPSAPFFDPADALFDGDNRTLGDGGGHTYTISQIGTGTNAGTPMSTVGAFLEFTFPRKVVIHHILFQIDSNAQEALDSGGNPTVYGKWHWEISTDGSTYAQVGPSWHFREACTFMVAPTTDGFGLVGDPAVGDGIQHWRMVLESGPAFGAINIYQIMLNIFDSQDVGVSISGGFSDSADDIISGTLTVIAGDPSKVNFTDDDDDALTGTLTVIPNFTLSGALSDGDSDVLEGFASFSPLIIPQQMVISTGRKT